MKRRMLDIMLSTGGVALAGLLLVLGFVLASNASFAQNYVKDQLSEQKITFKAADELTPAEKAYTDGKTGCLYTYAGQALTTGKQAECYANEFIIVHLRDPNGAAKGMTYAELGTVQTDLRTQITAAQASGDPALPALQKQLADLTAARETVFKGEMLRSALLTSFGFSILGEKTDLGAKVAYGGSALFFLLSIAGFVHAFVTPKTRAFAPVERPHSDTIDASPARV